MQIEYIRKQDAVNTLWKEPSYIDPLNVLAEARDRIESLEPADVAKIVRCKNCKYRNYDEVFCCYWCEHEGMVREVKPDFYCGYGEE